jgi:hypothetical protein
MFSEHFSQDLWAELALRGWGSLSKYTNNRIPRSCARDRACARRGAAEMGGAAVNFFLQTANINEYKQQQQQQQ